MPAYSIQYTALVPCLCTPFKQCMRIAIFIVLNLAVSIGAARDRSPCAVVLLKVSQH